MAKRCCERDCNYDGDCDKHPGKVVVDAGKLDVLDLNDRSDIISVYVEGGIVQDVLNVPHGYEVKVIDYDNDNEDPDDDKLSRVRLIGMDQDDEPMVAMVSTYAHEAEDGEGLTAEQRQKYLNSSAHCPFCDSDDISGDEVNIDIGVASQTVRCSACGKEWTDIYTLSEVVVHE